MSYQILPTPKFEREFAQLLRRYRSLKLDMATLALQLAERPNTGTPIGGALYKVRLAIRSKNKGKSGGARVITFVYSLSEQVYLMSIYDKSEREDLTPDELAELRLLAKQLGLA